MKEVTLLSAELAYLFSLLNVESAVGVDADRLFPKKDKAKVKMFTAGYDALKAREWISKGETSGKDQLNNDLMRFVEVMARPRFAIITEVRSHPERPPKRIVHYVADHLIIEQAFLGRKGYRLTEVEDLTTALLRINRAIGIPDTNRVGDHNVTLNGPVFAKIKQLADAGDLKKALPALKKLKLDETAAQAALISMSRPRTSGTISILELRGQSIIDANALAYFIGEGGGWVALRPDIKKKSMMLRTIDDAQMWALLSSFMGDLIAS